MNCLLAYPVSRRTRKLSLVLCAVGSVLFISARPARATATVSVGGGSSEAGRWASEDNRELSLDLGPNIDISVPSGGSGSGGSWSGFASVQRTFEEGEKETITLHARASA